ncbi:MAG: hypothetical protein SWK76_05630 [Actinomycetota bacterium]|nr:hypothetical protein [Actinomycetota bacterium]
MAAAAEKGGSKSGWAPYPVSIYSVGLAGRKLKLQYLLPSEGLRTFRFNWYRDSRRLGEAAFSSCWERSRELLSREMGGGYRIYLSNQDRATSWLLSRHGEGEAVFDSWDDVPLAPSTRIAPGEWRVRGGPFRVSLRRHTTFRFLPGGGRFIIMRAFYRSELLGLVEHTFSCDKEPGPDMLAGIVRRGEREKAEKNARRIWRLMEEGFGDPPRLRFQGEWSREIYALLSQFLSGRTRKAEFPLFTNGGDTGLESTWT